MDPAQIAIRASTQENLPIEDIRNDLVILKDGSLLMGKGSRLYQFHPRKNNQWEEVAELKNLGISRISRMAVSGDGKLVLVN